MVDTRVSDYQVVADVEFLIVGVVSIGIRQNYPGEGADRVRVKDLKRDAASEAMERRWRGLKG